MSTPETHPAFEWVRSTPVESMNVEVQEYRHRKTGARHVHIAAEDDQNAFLVGFATVPQDSTGVAHILEHTALCGSRKFEVRDPFFMMIRRSLNTFMNAFTAPDWTAYPFATRNRKDFYNLLEVYLDAAFFPNLHELDFSQEGHRVEFAEPDDPESDLVFKGVVYNEMKGAMSSPVSVLFQKATESIFPTVTYHYNSGGDPERIPDLTHERLKAFHARHYHPANAVLMTYGDLSPADHQQAFEEQALGAFESADLDIGIPDEQRYTAPVAVEERYPIEPGEETKDKTHITVGWLLEKSTDPDAVLTAHLLSGVLLDNGASPLRRALETTDLGEAPSPLCGLEDGTREMFFSCGVEGSNPDKAEAVERLVLDTLKEVAEKGVDKEMVESVLHQLELNQREIRGDGLPYGLQLMVHTLAPAFHGADPAEVLNIDPVLKALRERIQDPDYIPRLVRERLLDNPHRVRLTLKPDPELPGEIATREQQRLAEMKAALSEADRQQVVERAAELAERQMQEDDPEKLPKVDLADIPQELAIPEGREEAVGPMPATWYHAGTNGLVYQEVAVELPELDDELVQVMPLLCDSLTEVGSAGRDYLETQARQAAVTGGLGARATVRGGVEDVQDTRGLFVVSGKALTRNQQPLTGLLQETFEAARFDELPRLRELSAQERLRREQEVTGNGHILAMTAATSAMSPSARLGHEWGGLEGLRRLKELDDGLDDDARLEAYAARLQRLRDTLLEAPRQALVVGEAGDHDAVRASLEQYWGGRDNPAATGRFRPSTPEGRVHHAWTTNTQVNFCARAYPAVPPEHADAPALLVLGGFLRNGFLHRAIREQGGAYGGGASFDPDAGAFRFFSYRDPRLGETLDDFDAAVRWLLDEEHEWRTVEEAILGAVGGIDKPGSPAGEAKKAFYGGLYGRTPEQRRRFRARVLEVRLEDLRRVAETYLTPERAHTAVITSTANLERYQTLGLEPVRL